MKYLLALAMLLATASAEQGAKIEVVQLRDEPGRHPFQQTVVNSVCEEATTCQVTFSAVPAHTRLVVTRFNASAFNTNGSNTMVYSVLTDPAETIVNTFPHTTPVSATSFANESTLVYYEAGQTPIVNVNNEVGLINIRVTLSGYLVHLP